MSKKAALHNLGCKVNSYETEAMRQLLEEEGYEIVPFAPGADVYVINTCSVTNIADRKSRQMLHRARKMNPQAIVVAAGCYVQTAQNPVEDDVAIDIVLGNNNKKDLIQALHEFEACRAGAAEKHGISKKDQEKGKKADQEIDTPDTAQEDRDTKSAHYNKKTDINHTKEYESLFITRTEEHTRAYMKVQDGCNQFCSYCIIPYARGRVRSREMDDVLREAKALAENGCKEIVLTGIHLSSYGVDHGTTLLELICAVHEIEGIERIRLGSLEPGIVTEEFAEALAKLPKFCPHFHLSLQSGCSETLKRMNRRYTSAEFEERCAILRRTFTDPAITTDVIVGFPGETQEEFHTTVKFLTRIKLYETHIFKYSKRHGTRAAVMKDQIPESEKGVRSDVLIELGEKNRRAFEQKYQGREVDVLFEEKVTIRGQEYYIGYTKEYIRAAVPAEEEKNYENRTLRGILGGEIEDHIFLFDRQSI